LLKKFYELLLYFLTRMKYYPTKSISEIVDIFVRETNNPEVDSVEGIMFSLDEGVIMSGNFVEKVTIFV